MATLTKATKTAKVTKITTPKGKGAQRRTASKIVDTGKPEVAEVQHQVANVLASVPSSAVAKAYVHRKIAGKNDFAYLDIARAHKMNVLIEGPTGPGKTMFTRAWAAHNNRVLARIPSSVGLDPAQLFGRFVPVDGGWRWVDGPVSHVVRHGGVLLWNEVNLTPERVSSVAFGLLDDNREIVLLDHEGEILKAHDDLLIVADMNPDYEGTRPMNKAFRDRFGIQLVWDYDPDVEKQLVKSKALLAMARDLRAEAAKGTYETPISTRMLMEFERLAGLVSLDFALLNFANHFASDERAAVQVVAQTFKGNIARDYAPVVETEQQTVDPVDTEDDLDTRRANMKDGDVDPEWGIKGTDWVWEDEAN